MLWWQNETIAEDLLAPDACVAGLLRFKDNGSIGVEIDGYLSNPHGPMAAVAREPVTRCIQGLLKGTLRTQNDAGCQSVAMSAALNAGPRCFFSASHLQRANCPSQSYRL